MRSEGRLLADLIIRERPEVEGEVRRVLQESSPDAASLSTIGQSLIRAKVISPKEFLACRALVEEAASRRCPSCAKRFAALAAPETLEHTCACGHVTEIRGVRPPFSSASSRRATQTGRQARQEGGSRRSTGYTSKRRKGDTAEPAEPAASGNVPERIGRYRILGQIGGGGMGLIYAAKEPETGRRVALKILRRGASADAETRFEREAQAIARLAHPAVIKVHDVGRDERTGTPFFTMDLVEGRELQEVREELSREELLGVVATVADGLHHAHEHGIVHRDVKPQNILLDASGEPKIADFGLARDLGRSSLTEDGDLIGTPLFMSPEQLRGDPSGIDRRTDVYALGVVLYQGLTGQLPVDAGSFYELQKKMSTSEPEPPSAIADVPRELDGVVLKALAKRPEDRYPTAAELAADLRRFLAGQSVEAQPMGPAARAGRKAWDWLSSPWGIVAVGAVLLLGILGAFMVHVRARAAEEQEYRKQLDVRRGMCLSVLGDARGALEEALTAWNDGRRADALHGADETERLAGNADAQALELGVEAPDNVRSEAKALVDRAIRLRAAALTAGSPEEQARAHALYLKLVDEHPRDADLRLDLGRIELHAGRVLAAAKLFKQVAASDDHRLDAVFYKAEASRLAGQPQFARFDYERALSDPAKLGRVRPSTVLAGLAQAHLALGDDDAARQALERAQAEDPQDSRVRLVRVALLQARGEHEAALAEVQLATRSFPDDPEVRFAAGRAWAAAGVARRARTELDAALALRHSPTLWAARGRLRALLGDEGGADADFARALAKSDAAEPLHPGVVLAHARTLRGRGKIADALAVLTPVAAAKDATPAARLERAELMLADGDLEKAAQQLERVLSERSGDPRALRGLAWIALTRADMPGTLARLKTLLALRPEDVVGLALQAHVLALQGKTPQARAAAERARATRDALTGRAPGLWLEVGDPLREALTALHQGLRAGARAERAIGGKAEELRARARTQLARAVQLAPWWVPARVALAAELARAGDDDGALAELARARASGQPSIEGDRLRGELLARARKHDDAVRTFGRALARLRERDDAASRRLRGELLLARARSLQAQNQSDEALAALDDALRASPKLLDAFELRASLRDRTGDAAGSADDRQRVELLRSGYVRVYREAKRAAWRTSQGGQHRAAIRELEPAFALVDRERDPARCAELYLIRAYMQLRCVEFRRALVDQAAMLELAPGAFGQVYDELNTLANREGNIGVNLDPVLRDVHTDRKRQDDVDPDFLAGYLTFVGLEFAGDVAEGRLRGGIRALDRYLARRPGQESASLLRAALLLKAGQVAEAIRGVVAVLDAPEPSGFAHYMLTRLQTSQGDTTAALRSLETALNGGFHVYEAVAKDPALAPLRGEARYQSLIKRSQGRGYLEQVKKAELLSREKGEGDRAKLYGLGIQSASTGLGFLTELIRSGDREGLALAAQLHLIRGKLHARRGEILPARRDLAAALEADPLLLLSGDELAEAARAVGPLIPRSFKDARPEPESPLPTRLRLALPVVLAALAGEATSSDDLAQAARLLESAREDQRALLVVIRLAEGDSQAALRAASAARELEHLAPLVDYLSARVHAALGHTVPAMEALTKARQAGLRPFPDDPTLVSLRGQERFKTLFPQSGTPPRKRWRR